MVNFRFIDDEEPASRFSIVPTDPAFNPLELSLSREKEAIKQGQYNQLAQQERQREIEAFVTPILERNKIKAQDDPGNQYDFVRYFDDIKAGHAAPPKVNPTTAKYDLPPAYAKPGHPDFYKTMDPGVWTLEQSKRFLKDHPARTPEEEAENDVFLRQKEAQLNSIKAHMSGYDAYTFDQQQADLDSGKVYPHLDLLKDPEKMTTFQAFAVPYTKGVQGFFTRPFGKEPLENITPATIKQSEKDHPVASAIGKAFGGVVPMSLALTPEGLLPQIFAFGATGAMGQAGKEKMEGSLMDQKGSQMRIAKATVKSAAYAPLFYYTKAITLGGKVASVVARAGARGAGATGIEAAGGATPQEAVTAGLATAALSGLFEITPIAAEKINTTVRNKSLDTMAETLIKNDNDIVSALRANYKSKYGVEPSEEELTKLVRAGLTIEATNNNLSTVQLTRAADQFKKRFEVKTPEVLPPKGERGSVPIPFNEGDIVQAGDQIGRITKIVGDKAAIVNSLGRTIEVPKADLVQTGLLPQDLPAKNLEKVPEAKRAYVKELFKMENPQVVHDLINNDPQYQADLALNKQLGNKAFNQSENPKEWPVYYKAYIRKHSKPNIPAATGKPELVLWMGLPGSGKSQISKQMGLADTHVQIDPDDAKLFIPESVERPQLAQYVQNESAHMAEKLLLPKMMQEGKNILWLKIGKNSKTIEDILRVAKEKGYKTKVYFNDISAVESKKRAYKRYLEEKRLVSADYIDSIGDLTIKKIYDKVKVSDDADEHAAWNVNTRLGVPPTEIDKGSLHERQREEAAATDGSGSARADTLGGPGRSGSGDRAAGDASSGGGTSASEVIPPGPQEKVRRFINTVKQAPNTRADVADKVAGNYTPISNPESVAEAKALLASNPDEAHYLINKTGPISRLEATMGGLELERLQQEGKIAEAVTLAEHLAKRGTEGGQGTQALYIYERLSPEGIIMTAQRAVRQARENGGVQKEKLKYFDRVSKDLNETDKDKLAKKLGIPHISDVVAGELRKMAEQIQTMPPGRDKEIETALMLKKIGDQIPKTFWDKVSMTQTIAQLLNPKTFVRNLLGNAGFQVAENVSDTLGAALDVALSLKTGKRIVYVPNLKTQAQGLSQGFKEGTEEALLGVDLKNSDTSKFTLPKGGVFDTGVMGALEKTLRVSLGATDRAFYQAAFNQSIREQMASSKLEEPSEEMIEKAHLTGLYKTFQDDNVLSRQFVNLKRWLNVNGKFGLGDIVLKYPKTPANILARGLEYSPFGFAKMIYKMAQPLTGTTFDQEAFVRSASRAFTGSALLVGAGAMLATLGIISGKRSKDKDVQASRENVGIRDYQINTSALKRFAMSGLDPEQAKLQEGDNLVTYDWMQPASIGVALGANMVLDPKSNLVDRTLNLGDRMLQASETLQEQPLVQGVKVLTSKQNLSEGLSDVAKGMPASFVPTLLNQVRQLTDNTARNTKDPNWFKEAYNKALVRIPGASQTLPPRIDSLGRDKQMYQGGSNNPFNVFLNPAFVSKYKPDPVSKMVLDIWENSGQTIQLPRVAQAKIKLGSSTPEPIELTPAQYTEFQRYIGNKTDVLFTILKDKPAFMQMDDETKAKKLQGYLTDINTAAKIEVLGYRPKRVDRDVRTIIKDIGRNKRIIDDEEAAGIRSIDE